MKTITLFLALLLSYKQPVVTDTKDFEVTLEKSAVRVSRASSERVAIALERAKGYQKASAKMGLSSFAPTGVSIQFNPAEGAIHQTEVIITADSSAVAGTYTLIIKATLNNKVKGTTLKLTIL